MFAQTPLSLGQAASHSEQNYPICLSKFIIFFLSSRQKLCMPSLHLSKEDQPCQLFLSS